MESIERVELHCHTKMSEMDAVTDIADVIRRAYELGHPAVAITDMGVVHALPEAAQLLKDGGIIPEDADFKIIYGMEGWMVDDEVEFDEPYHITMLARNQVGLRNLYRLVTLSHLRYFKETPIIPRNVLEEHREGLLIGSGCTLGEIYRLFLEDRSGLYHAFLEGREAYRTFLESGSGEKIRKAVSFYDYLEVQPPEVTAGIQSTYGPVGNKFDWYPEVREIT